MPEPAPLPPRGPDYTRIAADLPPVYQDDAESFAQIDAYLGLADELGHQVIERLEDLLTGLGPDALLRWPTGLALDAGADALIAHHLATYDELAGWSATAFPASWPRDEAGVRRRREFLARCTRIWRRRGTPRGFLSWFCLYFGLPAAGRPYLLEHFKAPGTGITAEPYTATLFVPATTFTGFERRAEAADFAVRYAPAHVQVRVCFTDPEVFTALPVLAAPPLLPEDPSDDDVAAYATAIDRQQRDLNALLCSVVSVVSHASGIHLYECIDAGRGVDRLGVGQLPTDTTD
ncbi:hypothetical protein [Arthrobacter sp. JSM 101049]|uniref:hypothetical protein n=1 Tax=Arthrobacter sp. JSM 101049 TaxID=929097 RepID=UPI0035639395